jgi:putative hemolysin
MGREGVEVGRACIAREHRHRQVLYLLWKGLASYMEHNRCRYLFGCCSLTSQDPGLGLRALAHLEAGGHLHAALKVSPRPGLECALPAGAAATADSLGGGDDFRLPALFQSYLRAGAKVCGPPALDREFKTIDFFVVLDLEALAPDLRRLFF